jgi:hypothetical protein
VAVTPTRRRRQRANGAQSLEEVQRLVDELIKENRTLKRQLAKLEASGATVSRGRRAGNPAEKALTSIKRRLERAMSGATSTRRGRGATATAKARTTRRPASPETAEKRRAALEKARQARAERRAAAAASE